MAKYDVTTMREGVPGPGWEVPGRASLYAGKEKWKEADSREALHFRLLPNRSLLAFQATRDGLTDTHLSATTQEQYARAKNGIYCRDVDGPEKLAMVKKEAPTTWMRRGWLHPQVVGNGDI